METELGVDHTIPWELLQRKNGAWASLSSGTGVNLRGAWVDSTGVAWIVGDSCTKLAVPLP